VKQNIRSMLEVVSAVTRRFDGLATDKAKEDSVQIFGFDGDPSMQFYLGDLRAITQMYGTILEIISAADDYETAKTYWAEKGIPGKFPGDQETFLMGVLEFFFTDPPDLYTDSSET